MKKNKNNKNKNSEELKENVEVTEVSKVENTETNSNTETEQKEDKKEKKTKKEKKAKKEKKQNDENKVKLREKFSLNLRKKWLVGGFSTFLVITILVLAYIALNLGISNLQLPELDVTKSKLYSLSDDSKKALEKVNQDVKIYVYGYEEDSQLIKFLKQYNKVNEKITYEILTEETNYEKIKENELKDGYYVLIFESGDAKKIVDTSTDFTTVDYTTYQEIDIAEQSITNAILSLMVENKPKVYFTTGHGEYDLTTNLSVLQLYLQNESFETQSVNLVTLSSIPEDCDVLVVPSPQKDFLDVERDMVLNYISQGGKIYLSIDPLVTGTELPNIKTILSQYGVSVENGQIIELSANNAVSASPNVFKPSVSPSSSITSDIYTSGGEIWLAYSNRLNFESEETLASLNVVREDLMSSSETSIFITDLSTDIETAVQTAQAGYSIVASKMTKTINSSVEGEDAKESVLIVSGNGSYIADFIVQSLSANYPMSYIGNNKDFAINCIADLANKEGLTIRKEIVAQSTYVPTQIQSFVVLTLIFGIPVLIIMLGIVIWSYRKRRK